MKIKSIITALGIAVIALLSTAFIRSNNMEIVVDESKMDKEFLTFLSNFEKVELPYEIGLNDFKGYKNYKTGFKPSNKIKDWNMGSPFAKGTKFIPESETYFSREGRPEVLPVVRFYPNEKTVAVIYSSKRGFGGELNIEYNTLVYDLKGNIVSIKREKGDSKKYAFSSNGITTRLASSSVYNTVTCSIDAKGNIWKNTYKNIWKKDERTTSYEENELLDFKLEKTEVFNIGANGLITELKEYPTTARASLD